MGRKPWIPQVPPVTVRDIYPAIMRAKVSVNPNALHHRTVHGRLDVFTDEQREIAGRFSFSGKLEEAYQDIARWYKLPLNLVRQVMPGGLSLESAVMQVHLVSRKEAEVIVRSGRGVDNESELGAPLSDRGDYFWYLRRMYKLPVVYLDDIDSGKLTIEESLVLVYGFSPAEAHDVRWGTVSLTEALSKKNPKDLTG